MNIIIKLTFGASIYPDYVSIETEEIENFLAVHLLIVQSIDHQHRSLLQHGTRAVVISRSKGRWWLLAMHRLHTRRRTTERHALSWLSITLSTIHVNLKNRTLTDQQISHRVAVAIQCSNKSPVDRC